MSVRGYRKGMHDVNSAEAINPIKILLADDDGDDRYLFEMELKELPFNSELQTVEDGEKLMAYLVKKSNTMPDMLFLDHNMPRKKGLECLLEIKLNSRLKDLPVIIYSTHIQDHIADIFYKEGAHFYLRKGSQQELKTALHHILADFIKQKTIIRPPRTRFVLGGNPVL